MPWISNRQGARGRKTVGLGQAREITTGGVPARTISSRQARAPPTERGGKFLRSMRCIDRICSSEALLYDGYLLPGGEGADSILNM
jgi:hypothetical protein